MSTPAPEMRAATIIVGLAALLGIACAARLGVGTSTFGFPSGELAGTLWELRLHRLWIGLTVGAALALAGVALQALLRNPLAEPFILGLSTGAGVGVMLQGVLVYYMAADLGTHFVGGAFGAVAGAAASMVIVYLAGQRRGVIDPLGLLLTGVVLSTINSAIMMLLNYVVGPGGLRDDMARWMMGYLNDAASPALVWTVAAITIGGSLLLGLLGTAMDVATLSDSEARSIGVNMRTLRLALFVSASVLTAGAVALAGPIAFVGLICPHVARLLLGPAHGPLVVGSMLLGATLIVVADTLSAGIAFASPRFGIVPIGVFTAMIGGPAFLWMLRPQLGRGM